MGPAWSHHTGIIVRVRPGTGLVGRWLDWQFPLLVPSSSWSKSKNTDFVSHTLIYLWWPATCWFYFFSNYLKWITSYFPSLPHCSVHSLVHCKCLPWVLANVYYHYAHEKRAIYSRYQCLLNRSQCFLLSTSESVSVTGWAHWLGQLVSISPPFEA